MNTDEIMSKRQGPNCRRRRRVRGMGGRMPAVDVVDSGYRDAIAHAVTREREHRRVVPLPMEFDCVLAHVFRCGCCGRVRDERERREPQSEVCVRCVSEAGF